MEAAMIGSQVRNDISFAVAKKAMDAQEMQGEAVLSMLESAAQTTGASRGSVSPVPTAGETGRMFDTFG